MELTQAVWVRADREQRGAGELLAEARALLKNGYYRPALRIVEELEGRGDAGSQAAGLDFATALLGAEGRTMAGRYRLAVATAERALAGGRLSWEQELELRWLAFRARSLSAYSPEVVQEGADLLADLTESPRLFVHTAGRLAAVQARRCHFGQAREWLQEAEALLGRSGRSDRPGPAADLAPVLLAAAAEVAAWEGDYGEAMRLSARTMAMLPRGGPWQVPVALQHVHILLLNGRAAEAGEALAQLEPMRMSYHHELTHATLAALALAGKRQASQAVQHLSRAMQRWGAGGEESDAGREVLWLLAEAALATPHPLAQQVRGGLNPAGQCPGLAARMNWVCARVAFSQGSGFAGPLQQFVAICEEHGLAGLLHRAALAEPRPFVAGLAHGVASVLYPALLPALTDPETEHVAGQMIREELPSGARWTALQLLARRPGHPAAQRAARAAQESGDPLLQAAAQQMLGTEAVVAAPPALEFRSLGACEVICQGEVISGRWRRKTRALFVMLLMQSPRTLSRASLAETLWPDLEPRAAANNLRVTIHQLRQGLAAAGTATGAGERWAGWIETEPDGIRLAAGDEVFWDVRQFEQLVAGAGHSVRQGRKEAAITALRQAVALYRGPFLPGPAWDGLFDLERHHYERVALGAMVDLGQLSLERGDAALALRTAEAAVRVDRFDERANLLLVRAHVGLGLPGRALESYRRYQRWLERELGEKPSREFSRYLGELAAP